MKISLGCDHAGFELKKIVTNWLKDNGHQVLDFGCYSTESVDYPDFAFPTAEAVAAGIADYGIVICGSGVGVSIVANKVTTIRCALCCSPEIASIARKHNNANVLALGARFISSDLALQIVRVFIEGEFEGDRHMIRVEKIHSLTGW